MKIIENDHKDLYMLLGSNHHYYIKTTIYFFFKEKKSFVHSQSKHAYFLSKYVIQNCFVIISCTWLYECDMIKSRNRLVEAAFIGQYSKHRICFFRSHQKIREITSFTYVRNSPFRRHWRESVHWLIIDFDFAGITKSYKDFRGSPPLFW